MQRDPRIQATARDPQERIITLALPESAAEVLRVICGRISGDPEKSARGVTDDIARALINAGVKWRYEPGSISDKVIGFLGFND